MGLLGKLKEKGRGIVSAAKPAEGVPPATADEVAARLRAISGTGITTTTEDDAIVVAWAAKVESMGGEGSENLYRAIRVTLDPGKHTATGLCLKRTTTAAIEIDGTFTSSGNWERGQHVGTETRHVVAWLGASGTEDRADEQGYSFSWSDLRGPVMEAVTGAGWTYKPKKV